MNTTLNIQGNRIVSFFEQQLRIVARSHVFWNKAAKEHTNKARQQSSTMDVELARRKTSQKAREKIMFGSS
jgi:hypothetical protein